MLAEVFVAFFLLWFSQYIITTYWRRKNMPPGPLPYPFIGNLPHLLCDPVKPFAKLAEKHGDIYSLSFGNIEAVVLGTDSLIREARLERKDDFAGRDASVYPVSEIMDGTVVFTDFSPLHRFRKGVLKAGLHLFGSGIDEASGKARNAVGTAIEDISFKQGRPFSPQNLFHRAIMVQLWQWLTSKKYKMNDPVIKDLTEFVKILIGEGFRIPLYNILPFLRFLPGRFFPHLQRAKVLRNKLFCSEYEQHKKSYDPSVVRDLIDCFISSYEKEIAKETGKDVESHNIVGLMMDFITAGSDTTAVSLTWFLFYMVRNPNVQRKIQDELDLVVGRDRFPVWNDVEKMSYLQAALCEVQRASGLVPMMWSNAIRDSTISGYHIRKGTFLALNLYKLHHDEKVWPEPEKFKPERFLKSDGEFIGWDKVYAFLPFGLGRRQCPGQALAKIILFTFASLLLHRYKFELPEGAEIPASKPVGGSGVLQPNYFEIVAKERFCVQK